MGEMWSYYQGKKHQVWLWWTIYHDTGEVMAYWFGTREHKHWDWLLELLEPLSMAKVYTDDNDAYDERFYLEVLVVSKQNTQKIERKHLSLRRVAVDWYARAFVFRSRW